MISDVADIGCGTEADFGGKEKRRDGELLGSDQGKQRQPCQQMGSIFDTNRPSSKFKFYIK
jgi:hypothetical protein